MDVTQAMQLIKERRSIRRFTEQEVSRDILHTLIEAAVWAPSGSNAQAWEFVILEHADKKLMSSIVAFLPGVSEAPPAMICLCLNRDKEGAKAGKLGLEVMGIMDVSMAAQNIMLMAHALGLGSCAVGSFNTDVIRLALKLPKHIDPTLLMVLGYPKEVGAAPPRSPVEDNIHWGSFSLKEGK